MKNKKVIILWHNGGRLANQIWLFMNVYAYCLEKGYKLENHSFFEYNHLFNIKTNNSLIDLFFIKLYPILKKILPTNFYANQHNYFFRTYYKIYVKLIELFKKNQIIHSPDKNKSNSYYLPPTPDPYLLINDFDNSKSKKIYLHGWLFRNPIGIIKYQKQIIEYFTPKKEIVKKTEDFIDELKLKYKNIVGVHIRQGDYKKEFKGGGLYFSENRVFIILEKYLEKFHKTAEETCFVLCSDGHINIKLFNNLNIVTHKGSPIEDLLVLSKTSTIIGADSTFGALASYYGNIPFFIFKDKIDWEYYLNKKYYFNNKYLTVSHN